jgi:hypothetical protein
MTARMEANLVLPNSDSAGRRENGERKTDRASITENDCVEEAGIDSFPASDAPPWTSGVKLEISPASDDDSGNVPCAHGPNHQ